MRRAVRWFWRSAFALAVAGALTFGGYQAFAVAAVPPCEFDPPQMGWCDDDPECQTLCDNYYGQGEYTGDCDDWNCCACMRR